MQAHANGSDGRKWHDLYPELGTGPLPIEPYVSREYFEKERERIFRKVWLNVGRVEQIPDPGDYFVKDLAVCHTSVLVVRGEDGKVRAFHNWRKPNPCWRPGQRRKSSWEMRSCSSASITKSRKCTSTHEDCDGSHP